MWKEKTGRERGMGEMALSSIKNKRIVIAIILVAHGRRTPAVLEHSEIIISLDTSFLKSIFLIPLSLLLFVRLESLLVASPVCFSHGWSPCCTYKDPARNPLEEVWRDWATKKLKKRRMDKQTVERKKERKKERGEKTQQTKYALQFVWVYVCVRRDDIILRPCFELISLWLPRTRRVRFVWEARHDPASGFLAHTLQLQLQQQQQQQCSVVERSVPDTKAMIKLQAFSLSLQLSLSIHKHIKFRDTQARKSIVVGKQTHASGYLTHRLSSPPPSHMAFFLQKKERLGNSETLWLRRVVFPETWRGGSWRDSFTRRFHAFQLENEYMRCTGWLVVCCFFAKCLADKGHVFVLFD